MGRYFLPVEDIDRDRSPVEAFLYAGAHSYSRQLSGDQWYHAIPKLATLLHLESNQHAGDTVTTSVKACLLITLSLP